MHHKLLAKYGNIVIESVLLASLQATLTFKSSHDEAKKKKRRKALHDTLLKSTQGIRFNRLNN